MLFNRKSLLIIGLLLCLLVGMSAVSAADVSGADTDPLDVDFLSTDLSQNDANDIENSLLNSTLDDADVATETLSAYANTRHVGTGQQYGSISAALSGISSNTEIIVHRGTYSGTSNTGLTISTSNIKISAYIDPNTGVRDLVVINGENSRNFVTISASNVVIEGFEIKNGKASSAGGGISIIGQTNNYATISYCNIHDCTAGSSGGGICVGGGAHHTIDHCIITDCSANYGGSMRFVSNCAGDCTISNCELIRGVAKGQTRSHGGACCIVYGTGYHWYNCTIQDCSAPYSGGIHIHSSMATDIHNCTFIGNKATGTSGSNVGYGGAVSIEYSGVLIEDSKFINNTAYLYGGGIQVGTYEVQASNTQIKNTIVTGNKVTTGDGKGAGIYIKGDNTNINNCTVLENVASTNGAGIYIEKDSAKVLNSIVGNNSAPTGAGIYIYGKNAEVTNCNISDNTATTSGAGIYIRGDSAKVTNSNLYNNTAKDGAGAYIYGLSATLNGGKISNNTATNDGAGVYVQGNNAIIKNADITGNKATNNGAGLNVQGTTATVQYCNITNNTAKDGAGAYIKGDSATVQNVDISRNTATNGAGLYISGKNAKVLNFELSNNTATNGAGAYINGNTATVNGGVISDNKATNGAGVYIKGEDAKVLNAEVNNNIADLGAGVYIEGPRATINNISANSNVAKRAGAVYVKGDYSKVGNSSFIDNNATIEGGAVYIEGKTTTFENDYFYKNNAIPDIKLRDQGCGGAVFINGNGVDVKNTTFSMNTARNGSAMYLAGNTANVKIYQDTIQNLDKNQAWVYDLPINFNSTTKNITSVLYGGNNILNAFYNTQGVNVVQLQKDNTWVNPVLGVENSVNGTLYYQDSRERDQIVNITVYDVDRNVIAHNYTKTDLYGRAVVNAKDLGEDAYFVEMYHSEDPSYKPITNITAINFESGILVTNTNMTYADYTQQIVAVYKFEDQPVREANLTFYARNLDTNETIYLGTFETGSGGEANLTDNSIINTLDVTHNNYEIIVKDLALNVTGNATLMIFPRNSSITNESIVINHGEDAVLDIDLIDLYNGDPIVNRDVEVVIKDKDGNVVKSYNLTSDANSQIHIVEPNLDSGNYTVSTVFNSTLSYNGSRNVSSIEVIPSAKLNITKVLDTIQDHYINGDEVNWTITVTNVGEVTAYDVNVTDLSGYLTVTGSDVTNGTFTNGIWTIGDLNVGDVVVLKLTTIINDGDVVAWNFVNVTATNYDNPYDTNKTQNVTIDVWPDANVTVSKTVNVTEKVASGDLVEWTITVTHVSGDPLTNVVVTDALPTNKLNIVSWNAPQGTSFDNTTRKWTIDNLNPTLNSYVLKLVTRVLVSNQNVTNVAIVGYNGTNGLDNDTNKTIEVLPSSNLQINKVIDNPKEEYVIGDIVNWTITVENIGENTATAVNVTDVMSQGLTITASNASVGTFANGIWTIGDLAPNTPVTLKITTKITDSDFTAWNYVNITTSAHDNPYNNKTRNVTVTVLPNANVTIGKVINGSNVVAIGDNITWVIDVKHVSGDALTDVNVTENLPEGLEIVDYKTNSTTSFNTTTGIWSIPTLNADNNNYRLVLITKVLVSNKNLTNEVLINYNGSNNGTNKTNKTVYVLPNADITINKTVDKAVAVINDTVTWTIVVKNNGPDDITGINVTDTLPEGLTNVTAPNATIDGTTVSWTIDLANGTSKTLTITAKINTSNKVIKNAVGIEFNGTDPDPSSNNASVNTTVKPNANVTITKVINGSNVVGIGDNVTWIITVEHISGDPLDNVVVTDTLPTDLEIVKQTVPAGTSFNNSTGVWTIQTIDNEKANKYVLVIVTKVNESDVNLTNAVVVSYNGTNVGTNNSNATVTVLPHADITVTKTVNQSVAVKNDIIEWTITVENNGPDNITGINVTDTLPDGIIVLNDIEGDIDGNIVSWTIDLANGENKTFTIIARIISSNVVLENGVVINFNGTDPNPSTNNDSVNVTVKPDAIVNITKVINGSSVVGIGDNVTWIITVEHEWGDPLINVTVSEVIPEGLEIVDKTVPKGTYYNETSGIWTIDRLNEKESIYELVLVTKVLVSDTNITNLVNVTYNGTNGGQNETNVTVIVLPNADVEISMETLPNETQQDGTINWVINVVNNGNDTAPLVNVTITLPEGVDLDNVILPNGTTYNNETGVWSIPELPVGENLTIVLVTNVTATNTTLTGFANVTFNGTNPSNQTEVNATVNILPSVDLNLNVTVDQDKVYVGDEVKVTIVLDNFGPDIADNTNVTINLPDSFEIKSFNSTNGTIYVPENNTWILGNITPGQYVLEIIGTFTKSGNYNINATVETDTPIALKAIGNLTSDVNITVEDVPVNGIGMLPTGNPLLVALFALLLIPVRLRRK